MLGTKYLVGIATLAAAALFAPTGSLADGITYFRRDNGRADNDRKELPTRLDARSKLVWRQELDPGISTPCVYGDLIAVTTWIAEKKQLATVVLDRVTGKVRWRQVAKTTKIEAVHSTGSPAASTPACDGQRLYVFFGSLGLLCYDLDGKLLWTRSLGPFQDEFGAASSPVLVDGKVILNEDHDVNSFVVAIDQQTGKIVWQTARPRATRSYSTPIVWEHDDRKELVVAGALKVTGYDIRTGRRLWWVYGLSRIVDSSPVVAGGLLYVATWTPGGDQGSRISMGPFGDALKTFDKNSDGRIERTELPKGNAVAARFFRIDLDQDGKLNELEWKRHADVFDRAQNAAIAIRPGGSGDVTRTHVKWTYREGLPVVPSPVVYRGQLYMVKNSGILTSLDARSGEYQKRGRIPGRGNYYASLVAGDGKVYAVSESGMVSVIRAGRNWEVIGSHDLGERVLATPVIADGRLYIRTDNALYCFGKR